MEKFKINSWSDYWSIFDKLIDLLKAENKDSIVLDFKDAQKYVNGLTDGFYEFKFAFEKSYQSNKIRMTDNQKEIADFLILKIAESLTKK